MKATLIDAKCSVHFLLLEHGFLLLWVVSHAGAFEFETFVEVSRNPNCVHLCARQLKPPTPTKFFRLCLLFQII